MADSTDAAVHEIVSDLDYPMLIVTAAADDQRDGCLVGFATQCSIQPTRFLVCLSKKNRTYRIAQTAGVLVVHFPDREDAGLAALFGTMTADETDKLANCAWHEGPGGAPVIDACSRWVAGRILDDVDAGDHVAFLVEPVAAEAGTEWPGQLGFQQVRGLPPGHEP